MTLRLVLLIFFLPRIAFACDVPSGKYEAITESEFSLSLEILENGRYRFAHKSWLPDDLHHVGEEHLYKGTFECEGGSLTLEYTDTGKPISGVYRNGSTSELKLPIDKDSMILDFTSASNTESIVYGWLYWPSTFAKELFK
jgi:hypothetical protein